MAAPNVRVKPGEVLAGKYRVERILGVGGMGVVVAAKHVELGQRVALKFMLKEAMVDPSHAERFLREARASVQLKSVHTARVLDVGKLKNGEPFMVMEYLEGRDLDEELRLHGPMPPHIACDFILQAAEALAEAHGLGMIHRDVKLKNLFRTATVDGRPLVKVLDFGLAKQTGIGGTDVSLTATSSVFGSPQYMSPEQMRSAKDVDTRSDIWSIGVCLYELLTGRVPFDAGGVAEICAMVLKDPVTPPSRWVRGLPPDLEAVVLRCLEKDPTRRFQTVAELAFALEPYAADEGSARRILHVMETAKKVEMPTIVSDGMPPMMEDVRAGTMAAFSTGAQAVAPKFPVWIPVGIVGAVMFLVGAGLIVTYWGAAHKRTLATQPSGEVATISSGVETAVPPPPPIPTDTNAVGTVIGTSEPSTPVVATTATATQPRATGRPPTPTFGTQRTPPAKPPATAPTVATKPTAVPPPVVPTGAPTPTNKDPGARY